jgi:2,4-dienoyl-CoA reductase-like NADH-dependent reductase (Old Yellow Enzyme family)
MPTLFDPIQIGDLHLNNRIIMAPLTRCRADEGRVPNALMAEYYVQRASAGLIISEATAVTPMGVGYPNTPGIWSDAQIRGWSNITQAVHANGGKIVLQLWHVGRISDPIYLNGELPVAPSAIQPAGHVSLVRPIKDFVTPRALETEEIADIVEAYRQGAENAMLPVSMAWKSTAPTVTCSTSSCRAAPTSAPTATAAASKTARVCCWK